MLRALHAQTVAACKSATRCRDFRLWNVTERDGTSGNEMRAQKVTARQELRIRESEQQAKFAIGRRESAMERRTGERTNRKLDHLRSVDALRRLVACLKRRFTRSSAER